jgi:hypothetical protein
MVGSASAWLPMGCAETLVRRLPDNRNQVALDTLAHRPGARAGLARDSPETRRSTSDPRSEVLRRGYGEDPARPARAPGAVSEDIAGGLIPVIWQPNHKGLSASHWQPGTCGAYDSLRLDCAKSLLGVQISIPGSDDRVRPPWRIGVLRRFSRYSCTSASSSPRLKADLRPCRAFPLLFAFSALCAAFAFRFGVRGWSRNRLTILLAYVRPLVINEPLIRPTSRRPVSFGRRPARRKSPEWG